MRPKVQFVIFRYGVLDRLTKRSGFINNQLIQSKALSAESAWQSVGGTFEVAGADVTHALPVLAFTGHVEVDDVVVSALGNDGAAAAAPLRRTLYLSFNEDFNAVTPEGVRSVSVMGAVTPVAGRQGRGAAFRRGMLTLDAEDVFEQNEGSVCFWMQPMAAQDDSRAHCLLEVPLPPYNFTDSGFVVSKGFSDTVS